MRFNQHSDLSGIDNYNDDPIPDEIPKERWCPPPRYSRCSSIIRYSVIFFGIMIIAINLIRIM